MSGSLKRQLAAVAPLAKRARPSEPAAAALVAVAVASPVASSSTRAAFIASLSTEPAGGRTVAERELLGLECDTLDESWLTLLQSELRKDYFLSLKAFLWTEGVRGVKDSTKGKVFPAGELLCSCRERMLTPATSSRGHLRLESILADPRRQGCHYRAGPIPR